MAQSTSTDSGVKIELAQLINFIDELRESGYNIGTSQYIAVQDLLLALHGRINLLQEPARLKLMLGPLLCTSPSEQAEFSHRFDQWLIQIDSQHLSATKSADYQANLDELERIARSAFRWSVALRLVLILLVPIIIGEGADPGRGRHEIGEIASEIVETVETVESTTEVPSSTRQPIPTFDGEIAENEMDAPVRIPRRDIEMGYERLLLIGLLVVLSYVVRQLWWRYKAQRFLTRYSTADSPTIHRLRVQYSNSLLFAPLQLSHIARDFRRRTDEPSSSIHILRTVDKTLKAGGWLTPVYRRRQALPEYLMLVDRASLRDYQSRYVTELVTLLQEQGVFTAILYFDGDPRRCVPQNEQEPPLSLEEVTAKYSQHRLVLFTDASTLFNPLTGHPEPWLDIFSGIPDRALLTPVPVMHWGYREQALAEQFIVLPATTDGLAILVEQLQRGQQAEALMAERKPPLPPELQQRPLRWLEREPPPSLLVERTLFELKEYLGLIGYTWLCACAVYPGLDWNLTLYLGNVVSDVTRAQQLVSERVLDLARLPWFRYGYMPDWLRILLIGSLPGQSEHRIRRSLNALLISAIQGGDSGFALEIAQSKNLFVSRLGQSLHQLLGQKKEENSPLQEHVYMHFMAGRKRQLAVQLPESLAKALFTRRFFQDKWRLGLNWVGANFLGYVVFGLLLLSLIVGLSISASRIVNFLIGLTLALASGAFLGFCQYLGIRNYVPVGRGWIWATTAGAALGTATSGIIILITSASSEWYIYIFAALISQCLISPGFQSMQLRPFTPNARRWLLVNLGGWTLGGVLGSFSLFILPVFGIWSVGVAVFVVSIGVYSWMTGNYLWQVASRVDPLLVQHKAQPIDDRSRLKVQGNQNNISGEVTRQLVNGDVEKIGDSSVLHQTWRRFGEIVDILGAIGTITILPASLTWLHEAWGPLSCVPDNSLWGWTTVGLLTLVPPVVWVHWKQALGIRRRWLIVLEVCLSLVLVFGIVSYAKGVPELPVLSADTFNIVVTTFGEGGRYTVSDGREQVQGNFVCNSVLGAEFTDELLISLDQTLVSRGSVASNIHLEGLDRYIHSQDEALEIAKAINATVLVWGWFLASDTYSFEPHFVVNDPNEAWEPAKLLTGLISTQNRREQVGLIQSRIEVLTDFTLGIFSMQEDVERAKLYFQRSLDTVLQEDDGAGLLPLLYYYTGRMDNQLGNSIEAEAKFDAGLAINREYAILYLSKGNIRYEQARQNMDDPAQAFALLDQAAALYQRTLDSLEKESTQFVDGNAHASLGHVALTRGQIDRSKPEYFQQALQEYGTAVQLFAEADAPGCNGAQVEISMAFVHEELQEIARAKTIYESVIVNSGSCIDITTIANERLAILGDSK